MLAARALLALALLAGACVAQFEAEAFKGEPGHDPVRVRGLYIPEGQCSGVINNSAVVQCVGGVLSVYARVVDGLQPDVSISNDKRGVVVRRARAARAAARCGARVFVDLHVSCRGPRARRRRRAPARLRPLPPAPSDLTV